MIYEHDQVCEAAACPPNSSNESADDKSSSSEYLAGQDCNIDSLVYKLNLGISDEQAESNCSDYEGQR